MPKRLKDKVAVITGGASGMGLAAVELFVDEGARVVVADIREDMGAALEARFGSLVRFSRCDVRREEEVAAAVALAVRTFGALDILYHSAGAGGARGRIESITTEQWDDTQNLLLRSSVLCIKHAAAPLRARNGGSIILTSSAAAINLGDGIGASPYIVAKAGVLTLCKAAALELAPDNIRVNAIIPGFFPTSIVGDAVGAPKPIADKMGRHLTKLAATMQPLPRAGNPKDIASAALFLASSESEFVTGTTVTVDGGLSLHRKAASAALFEGFQEARRLAEAELAAEARS